MPPPVSEAIATRGSDGWAGHQRMSAPRKRTRVAAARGLDMAAVAAATTPPVRLSRQGRCCWTRGQTSVLLLALIYSLGCGVQSGQRSQCVATVSPPPPREATIRGQRFVTEARGPVFLCELGGALLCDVLVFWLVSSGSVSVG
ncbi:hypothetical protein L914_10723 [Phytophthora nicotianae]|uniref:Uncharacterized protein n=2 Tax=Phytophthora nicotianae TaxID=4792 RepID=V9F174_PHYNI|nr:hypothetical protein F443_11171 [Phytophthora nicotianae P1569]ETM43981.1 hypothetical protein L914_10723 [Phytophthora nicotianae]